MGHDWTFLATASAVGVGCLQWLTLEKTDQTLRAAQRPWMKYDKVYVANPLTYDVNGMSISLGYLLKNTGNSPAQNVFPHTFVSTNPADALDPKEQRRQCEIYRNRPPAPNEMGFTYFPGDEPIEQKVTTYISKGEIAAVLNCEPPTLRFIFPVILGCINYRFPFGPKDGHQTGIMLSLNRVAREPPNPGVSVGINPDLGILQPDDLRLTLSYIGSYAD